MILVMYEKGKENDVRKYGDTSCHTISAALTLITTHHLLLYKIFSKQDEPSVFVTKFMQYRKMSVTACNVIRCGIRQRV